MSNPTTYQLIPSAQLFLQDLLYEIHNAAKSVDMQFYTFEADLTGRPLARALIAAHQRGVRVRLMVDHNINYMHNDYIIRWPRLDRTLQRSITDEWRNTNRLLKTLARQGIDIKMLHPFGFMKQRIFRRDHKKLVAIDGRVAYIGGINPSDHNTSWNDFMVKMQGDVVPLIADELRASWQGNSRAGTRSFSNGALIADAGKKSVILPLAIQMINDAQKRIIIESAYIWGKNLVGALMAAAKRGVRVDVIVPEHNNHKVIILTKKDLAALAAKGVTVHLFTYNNGMTHAKALVVDDAALFGSHNFNSFLAGKLHEACIASADASIVRQIETFLKKDMAKSRQMT